jgi:uncharacterized membrane protein YdjX (TVP38/TMEM64 family)
MIIAAAVAAAFYFNLFSFFMDRQKIIRFLTDAGPVSILIFIALQMLQVVIAPIPGELSGFIGGYLYGVVLGTIYSTIGLSLGSWAAFGLARLFGLPLVEKMVGTKILDKYDHFMEHKGTFVSFLLFLLPGFPKDALCYLLGLSHMGWKPFLVVSAVGRLFGTLILSVQGSLVRKDQDVAFFIVLAISGLVFIIGYFFGRNWLKMLHHKKKSDMQN